jgi:hypothetical protein
MSRVVYRVGSMRGLGGWGRRNPARDACGNLVVAHLAAERLQSILRPMPLEVKDPLVERHIPAQRRQAAIQQHIFLMNPETFGKPARPGTSQTPSARVFGNGLEVFVTGEHRGRRLGPPAGDIGMKLRRSLRAWSRQRAISLWC